MKQISLKLIGILISLKEYYEIVNGSPPAIGILPHTFLLLFVSHFTQVLSSVLTCDILGIGLL